MQCSHWLSEALNRATLSSLESDRQLTTTQGNMSKICHKGQACCHKLISYLFDFASFVLVLSTLFHKA